MAKECSVAAAVSTIRGLPPLRLVIMQIERETGDTHTAIELVLGALRNSEVFARGLYRGEREARLITDWHCLTIEVDQDSSDKYVVRWLDARHGSEPAVTNVIILRGEKYWKTLWPQEEPPRAEARPLAHEPATKANWQRDRVNTALKKLFPPDGEVPEDLPIVAVHRAVCAELEPDRKAHGLGDPSIRTVARAMGRKK